MNKNLLIIGIICVLVSCRHVEKQHEVAPIPVQVMSICEVADSVVRHYTGSLEAVQTVELTFFPVGRYPYGRVRTEWTTRQAWTMPCHY